MGYDFPMAHVLIVLADDQNDGVTVTVEHAPPPVGDLTRAQRVAASLVEHMKTTHKAEEADDDDQHPQ